MRLIVGLGNPNKLYKKTFHNVGFMVVDLFAKNNKLKLNKNKCKAKIAIADNYILCEPQTYMNLSGDSVLELKKYFKVKNEDILIILDDIDLKKGDIRFRINGSAGTHNGLRDILAKVGETPRLRIGIGRNEGDLAEYVLSDIDCESKALIDSAIEKAQDVISKFIEGDM